MTERGSRRLSRTAETLTIGASSVRQTEDCIEFSLDERAAPVPRAVRGRIVLRPKAAGGEPIELARHGAHFWQPLAPVARVEVDFESPDLSWQGPAYFDSNWGAAPLEDAFVGWDWSRSIDPGGATVLYDIERRFESPLELALSFGEAANTAGVPAGVPRRSLPGTGWGLKPRVRCDPDHAPQVISLEDTPFYARSLVHTRHAGRPVTLMHESLSLDRFRRSWVQALLGFRMPRIA